MEQVADWGDANCNANQLLLAFFVYFAENWSDDVGMRIRLELFLRFSKQTIELGQSKQLLVWISSASSVGSE
jgi:hypothetical protein